MDGQLIDNLCITPISRYLRPPRRVKGLGADQNVQGQVARLHGVEEEAVPCFLVACVSLYIYVCVASVGCPRGLRMHAHRSSSII